MSEELFYRLGRGSLREAKETLRKILVEGEIGIYLDEDSLDTIVPAINELYIEENLRFLRGESQRPGSINVDLFLAYIKSRRKLVVSDRELEEYRPGEEL